MMLAAMSTPGYGHGCGQLRARSASDGLREPALALGALPELRARCRAAKVLGEGVQFGQDVFQVNRWNGVG